MTFRYRMAYLWDRTVAFAADRMLVTALWMLVERALRATPYGNRHLQWLHYRLWDPVSQSNDGFVGLIIDATLGLTFMLPIIYTMVLLALYVVVFGVLWGGTPGMRVFGLTMETLSGRRPGALRILWRHALAHLSIGSLFAGYIWSLYDSRGRTWHDIASGIVIPWHGEIPGIRHS